MLNLEIFLLKDDDTSTSATFYANTTGDFEVGTNLDGFISNLHIDIFLFF